MYGKLRITLFILLTSCVFNAFATVSITRTSAPDFYINTSTTPQLLGQYVAYQVTNTSGATYEDVWVKISNFTGGSVTLGVNALDKFNLGSLLNNETKTAYFYLVADAAVGVTNTDQGHDIQIYDGTPTTGTLIPAPTATTTTFAFASIVEPGEAASNKVDSTLVGPTNPALGSEVTLTVVGDTGSLTGAGIFSVSPATYADWPAGTYQLISTEVTFVGDHSAEVMTDEMYRMLASGSSIYTVVYVFRAVNINQQPVTISPIANITNGTLKHTNTSNFNTFPPVQPVENLLQIKDKTVTPSLLDSGVGGRVTYTVSVENISSQPAELNDIIDILNVETPLTVVGTYVAGSSTFGVAGATPDAIYDPDISGASSEVLTWQRTFSVPAESIVELSYQVDIPVTDGAYGNSVLAHIGDVVIDNTMADTSDSSPQSVFVFVGTPEADLVTVKTVDDLNPNESQNITYTVTVTNNGLGEPGNIVVSDILPTGVTYSSDSASVGSYVSASDEWTISSVLGLGESAALTVVATVNASTAGTTLSTTSAVTSDQTDPSATGDVLSVPVAVNNLTDADLVTTISVDDANPNAGQTITYTIDVTNDGPGVATNVTLIESLPAGLTYSATTSATKGSYNGTDTWTIGSLNVGETATLTLVGDIIASAGTSIVNNTVSATGAEFDPSTAGDILSASLTVNNISDADLVVNKSVTNATPSELNAIQYIITLTNNGPAAANNINLIDFLPVGVSYLGFSTAPTATTYTFASGSWMIPSLAAGATETLTIDVTVDSGTLGNTITNTVTSVSADENDPDATGNVLSAEIIVQVDTTAPLAPTVDLMDASDLGASSTDDITSDTTPTLRVTLDQSGTTTDAVAGDVVKLFEGATQVGTATLAAGDITNGYVDITSSILSAGSLSFTATVTDQSSNVSSASSALAVSLDTTAPTLTVVLADSALIKGETSEVTFTFNETPSDFTDGDVTAPNGGLSAFTVTADPKIYTATFTPTDSIEEATNIMSVSTAYTDVAGNTGIAANSANYTIDTLAPVVATTSAPSATSSNVASYPVSGTCTTGDGDVTVSIAGVTLSQSVSCTAGLWGPVNFDVSGILDGSNVIDISASQTDSAGNIGNALLVEADKDTVLPTIPTVDAISIDSGSSDSDGLTNDNKPSITGTWDKAGATSLSVTVGTTTYVLDIDTQLTSDDLGNWTLDLTGLTTALADATYDVIVSATDAVGNVEVDASSDEFVIDTSEPIAPTVAAQTSNDATPVITGTAEADATVTVVVGGATYTVITNSSGDWTLDTATTSPDSGTLALVDGANSISVTSTDVAGNSNTSATIGTLTFIAFTDADNDGIPDSVECPAGPPLNATNCPDSDADGTPDYLDTDSDNDGISDAVEAGPDPTNPTDTDGGGNPDYIDADSDNDGILDADEKGLDSDNDGIPDYVDLPGNDYDGDGIPDSVECPVYPNCADTDLGGQPDYTDVDSDNDGISDALEAGLDPTKPKDTDGDGIPDYRDTDSDNDGVSDADEVGANPLSPTDRDSDGIPDYLDFASDGPGSGDSDGDGIADSIECALYPMCADSDADGTPDYMETDSDADGISDAIEARVSGTISGTEGIDDTFDVNATGGLDLNNDGVDDTQPLDSDGDGLADYQDADSDNDGISDADEVGLDVLNPDDSDSDGIPDYLDVASAGPGSGDSDSDGFDDATECSDYPMCDDVDADGTPDYLDSNHDDGPKGNIDGDGAVNYLDPDDDGDGVPDVVEDPNLDGDNNPATNPVDTDGDGVPNHQDTDSDNDGISDADEVGLDVLNPDDSDSDGIPDYLDVASAGPDSGDSDGDSIPDHVECPSYPACADSDNDGQPDYTEVDSDNDSIGDSVEFGALTSGNAVDTDGDGIADYQETDSDNDGISDGIEGLVDSDGDGIPDYVDVDSSGLPNGGDSDGDGVEDFAECSNYPVCPDADGDNVPDYMDADSRPYNPTDVIDTGLRGIGASAPLSLLLISGLLLVGRLLNRRYMQSILLVMVSLLSFQAQAEKVFDTSWYLGAGAGLTELEPNTKNTGYAIGDGSDSGYKLFLGYDFDEEFSLEIQYALLGKAQLSNQGNVLLNENAEIDYELPGVSVLWYGWHDAEDDVYTYRHGWQAFILGGISFIKNTANVPYQQVNSAQLHLGLGVEYGWDSGFAMRLAAESYDEDALFVYTSLIYRFGYKNKRECYRTFC